MPFTATDVYADAIARVCGDGVDLDPVECGLIHLKRHRVIFGRRLVTLLARHQRGLDLSDVSLWLPGLVGSKLPTKARSVTALGERMVGFNRSIDTVHVRRGMVICPGRKGGQRPDVGAAWR